LVLPISGFTEQFRPHALRAETKKILIKLCNSFGQTFFVVPNCDKDKRHNKDNIVRTVQKAKNLPKDSCIYRLVRTLAQAMHKAIMGRLMAVSIDKDRQVVFVFGSWQCTQLLHSTTLIVFLFAVRLLIYARPVLINDVRSSSLLQQ